MRSVAQSLLVALALSGCGGFGKDFDLFPKSGPDAIARLIPKNDSNVSGTITFTQRGDKVAVVASIHELSPGTHSLYIHQVGNCTSVNAASAGKVWIVPGTSSGGRRAGQLPELVAGSEGNADVMLSMRGLSVGDGTPTDVVGHSVVVHEGLDPDPQPEFGVRNGWIACGVIERK